MTEYYETAPDQKPLGSSYLPILLAFIAAKLILSFFPVEYGFFRDEFYYLSLSEHLDIGYVDVPPLAPFLLAVVRGLFGTSYFSLRLLPALSGVALLVLTALMVRRLGGGLTSLTLALTGVAFAPLYFSQDSMFTYDTFDRLFWVLMIYFLLLLIDTGDERHWIFFGAAAGLGLLTKISVVFLGFGLLAALLFSRYRKLLVGKKFLLGAATVFILFSPYLIWQVSHHFPTLEYFQSYAGGKTYPLSAVEFFTSQVMAMNPLAAPVWLAGIYYFLFHKKGRAFRLFGVAYLIVFALCVLSRMKFYILGPYYPILLAGGSVWLESLPWGKKIRLKAVYPAVIILFGLVLAPVARPILPVGTLVRYLEALGRAGAKEIKVERHEEGLLPQNLADRFGWEEMAQKVSEVYRELTEEEKRTAVVFTANYGEAGAINFFRRKYDLPEAVSGHNQHYFWMLDKTVGEVVILVGVSYEEELTDIFESVQIVGEVHSEYGMPYENKPIILCRGLKVGLDEIKRRMKHFG